MSPLDDALLLDLAKRDPALFFQIFRPLLLIDEIQYVPELLPYIKMTASPTIADIWAFSTLQ